MLDQFCTIVHPRSLEQLIKSNLFGHDRFTERQFESRPDIIGKRLVYPTLFESEGLKRIPAVVKLFNKQFMEEKFPDKIQNINILHQYLPTIDNLKLTLQKSCHQQFSVIQNIVIGPNRTRKIETTKIRKSRIPTKGLKVGVTN